jgi:FkbM family methyltransferase
VKRQLRAMLGGLGSRLLRLVGEQPSRSMPDALHALARRGHRPATVIDVGASDGRWSAQAMACFPGSRYLLVEAQALHRPALEAFCQRHANAGFVLAAAGETVGSIAFDDSDPFGGQASAAPGDAGFVELPCTTLDHEVASRGLAGPYLVKLDTHGFELPILRGAAKVLAQAEVLVVECYAQKLSAECLVFDELCAWLRTQGFRCIDLADPLYRPADGTLWQMDLVFVRADRPEFSRTQYA